MTDRLPKTLHLLIARFLTSRFYINPSLPLISQFSTYLQTGLSSLDQILCKYVSPVYKISPFKVKEYKNGRRCIKRNKSHPAFPKWDSLINRVHFSPEYSTTRLTFPWKGFYLPTGKICSTRDKYAFFAFVYTTDLFLGALPLWPMDSAQDFQLDRKDPLRHYTLDNVRWLNKSDNMAHKPSRGEKALSDFTSKKDLVRLLKDNQRSTVIFSEMLGALVKGYGTASIVGSSK